MPNYSQIGPIELIVLQGTSLCNLNCRYCYISAEERKSKNILSIHDMEKIFEKVFSSQLVGNTLEIIWHAGEPLTLPIPYYEEAFSVILRLKKQYLGDSFPIRLRFQTNGTLLSQEWCDFLKKHEKYMDIGLSLDGPDFIHDHSRKNWNDLGSFKDTFQGLELLIKNNVRFGIIAVVTLYTLNFPDEFFDFFYAYKNYLVGFHFNLEEPAANETVIYDEKFHKQYFLFIQKILDRLQTAPGDFRIGNFYEFWCKLVYLQKHQKTKISDGKTYPFKILNIDTSGNVSTFFAGMGLSTDELPNVYGDELGLMLGNLHEQSLEEIATSSKLNRMKQDFENSSGVCEKECDYFSICGGGYPVRKYIEHGTFETSETSFCKINIKTFADAFVEHINMYANSLKV